MPELSFASLLLFRVQIDSKQSYVAHGEESMAKYSPIKLKFSAFIHSDHSCFIMRECSFILKCLFSKKIYIMKAEDCLV